MPKRVQMTRNKPWRENHPHAVIVDRSTDWGNPFRIGEDVPGLEGAPMDAVDACQYFEFFCIPLLPVHKLAGKDLACWCPQGSPCHADVLLKYAKRCAPQKGEGNG